MPEMPSEERKAPKLTEEENEKFQVTLNFRDSVEGERAMNVYDKNTKIWQDISNATEKQVVGVIYQDCIVFNHHTWHNLGIKANARLIVTFEEDFDKCNAMMVSTMSDGVQETSQPFFLTLKDTWKDMKDEENAEGQPTARMIWIRLIKERLQSASTWPTKLLMSGDDMQDALDQMDDVEDIDQAIGDIGDFMMNKDKEENLLPPKNTVYACYVEYREE